VGLEGAHNLTWLVIDVFRKLFLKEWVRVRLAFATDSRSVGRLFSQSVSQSWLRALLGLRNRSWFYL